MCLSSGIDCISDFLSLHHACPAPEDCFSHDAFKGKSIKINKLNLNCKVPFIFQADKDKLSLALCLRGEGNALTKDRDFYGISDSAFFVLDPGRSIKVSTKSDFLDLLIYQINFSTLLEETIRQGAQTFDFGSVFSALPGNEQFFIDCAKQFLGTSKENTTEFDHSRVTLPLEDSLISFLSGLICSSLSALPPVGQPRKSSKEEYVAIAINFFEKNINRQISLDDVASECSVSPRSLQSAFQEVKNVSPLKLLQVMRLKRMHESIQRGFDVSDACSRSGLPFTGRTSSLYKDLFGESPSDTRRASRRLRR